MIFVCERQLRRLLMTFAKILTLFDYDVWVSEKISRAVSALVDDQYIRDL